LSLTLILGAHFQSYLVRRTLSQIILRNHLYINTSGVVTRLSHSTKNNNGSYTLNKNHIAFFKVNGEWSKNVFIDDELCWDYSEHKHFELERMAYTLPSDSTFREDSVLLKRGMIDEADAAKVKLEEAQRKDRKLRKDNGGKGH
jgi:hypothetical protein